MKQNNGFTLLELLITCIIIGIISLLSINSVMAQIPNFKVNEDIKNVEQVLKKTRSIAIKKSCTIKTDFSKAFNNNGTDIGGIIEIKDSNGNILDSISLNHNVYLNTASSTIQNNSVSFDYRGQPVDNAGSISNFNNTNNLITVSYYYGNIIKASKSLKVLPMTGNITD